MALYEADARIAVAAGVDVYKAVYFQISLHTPPLVCVGVHEVG